MVRMRNTFASSAARRPVPEKARGALAVNPKRVLLLALLLVAVFACQVAAAQPFAALSVTPTGRQVFDITTGVTTLPDGGVISDQSVGVTVTAQFVEYVAGMYVRAEKVEAVGEFGVLTSPELYLNLEEGTLQVGGGLDLVRHGLVLRGEALIYDAGRQIVVFSGGVIATGPTFETDRLYLDVTTGDVLLDGRFVFHDDLFVMESPEEGGRLELRFSLVDDQPIYDAATEVRPELLALFEGYL